MDPLTLLRDVSDAYRSLKSLAVEAAILTESGDETSNQRSEQRVRFFYSAPDRIRYEPCGKNVSTVPRQHLFVSSAVAECFQRIPMRTMRMFCQVTLTMALAAGLRLAAQVQTQVPPVVPGAKPVTVEHIKIHGTALEGNLEGDAVDRDAIVFLPPSYQKDTHRRYPVVYALHGYSIGAEQWTHEIHVPQTIEGAFAEGAKEMIVVLPDSKTLHNGSMYSSSVTTGDFEKFISHDVVAYMDAHYRTNPDRMSRGLVGHSMGGYGATRIGMKHSDVFGSLYIMSPCCLSARTAGPVNPEIEKALEAVKTPEDSANLAFFARAQLASAAAWSPDPKNPPLYQIGRAHV